MEWLLLAGAAVVGYFVFSSKKDPYMYVDSNGVRWGLYQYKDGSWEATVMDESAPTSYVETFKAKEQGAVLGMIDGYALSHKKDMK